MESCEIQFAGSVPPVTCTTLCQGLHSFDNENGNLPSHSDLAALLTSARNGGHLETSLGSWLDVQSRECNFCQLVAIAIRDSATGSEIDPEEDINIVLFPEEHSFRVSYPSRLAFRLVFLTNEPGQVEGPDNARPVHGDTIDIGKVNGWLGQCNVNHCECLLKPSQRQPEETPRARKSFDFKESSTSNFRALDLQRQCLVPISLDTKYASLSYVWGQLPMFRLRKENFEHLTTPGSLSTIRDNLPRTINDAIDFVTSVELRYLWIDGLCLVQDDESDVALGISMMNSIYNGSYFTIVAAAGADANAGLYGNRKQQIIKEVGTLRMTYIHGIDWHLKRSIYSERGWTLQELVLPYRTVIFIDGQVYFRCREANWAEETWADKWNAWLDPDDSNMIRLPDPNEGFLPCFWAYQKFCEDYSRRTIRRDGDAIRAIAGVTRPLSSGMETVMREGLPGYFLDHFLLFISSDGNLRRRPQFGSFSWAGWQGSIMWPRENFNWYGPERDWKVTNIVLYFKNHSLLEFHALSRSASARSLSASSWSEDSRLLLLMKEYPALFDCEQNPEKKYSDRRWQTGSASGHGIRDWSYEYNENHKRVPISDEKAIERASQPRQAFSIAGFDLANSQHEFDRLNGQLKNHMERFALMNWKAVRTIRAREATQTAYGPRPGRHWPSSSYKFRHLDDDATENDRVDQRTRSAYEQKAQGKFDADIPAFPRYTVLSFVSISLYLTLGETRTRRHRTDSPFDRIPGIPLLQHDQVLGSLHPDNVNMLDIPGTKIELVVIARANTAITGSALAIDDEDREAKLLWVLHVVWKDGIAERRGVGQILKSALGVIVDPMPTVRSILLG